MSTIILIVLSLSLVLYGMNTKKQPVKNKQDSHSNEKLGNALIVFGIILALLALAIILMSGDEHKTPKNVKASTTAGQGTANIELTPMEQKMFLSRFRSHPYSFYY